ncbi:MAG: hypothetical protein MJZ16_00530 [Bacteroidales bacterium]|nr:hypothetical protein [Bacteroidales bacterium]
MKKIFVIVLSIILYIVPAHAQLGTMLGSQLMKAVTNGAGTAVVNSVTTRVEAKAENMVTKAIDKVFGKVERDTLSTEAVTGMSVLKGMVGDVTEQVAGIQERQRTAGLVPLRDFSEQNAIRKEHNLTLTYDDWD